MSALDTSPRALADAAAACAIAPAASSHQGHDRHGHGADKTSATADEGSSIQTEKH